MYFKNESERTFRLEKQLGGCVGYKVVNGESEFSADDKVVVIKLRPGQDRTYLLKKIKK